jgi:hypothetical protein
METESLTLADRRQGISAHLEKAQAAEWLLDEIDRLPIDLPPHGLTADELRAGVQKIAQQALAEAVADAACAFAHYWREAQ